VIKYIRIKSLSHKILLLPALALLLNLILITLHNKPGLGQGIPAPEYEPQIKINKINNKNQFVTQV